MLWGAFVGVMVSAYTGNIWLAVFCGMLVGVLVALLLAVFHIKFGADLFLAGLAINLFSSGGTVFFLYAFTGQKGNTSLLRSLSVPNVNIPIIKDIPILGQIISGHPVFTYLAFLIVIAIYILLYRTKFGAHLRAVGENPEAATTLGINVAKVRYIALALSGAIAALGGMSLSMAYLQMFERDMANGRGWIGIAAIWLGAKHPVGTLIAAMIFGFADAIANQLGSLRILTAGPNHSLCHNRGSFSGLFHSTTPGRHQPHEKIPGSSFCRGEGSQGEIQVSPCSFGGKLNLINRTLGLDSKRPSLL